MLQRALQVTHPRQLGRTLEVRKQLNARTLYRAFVDRSLRFLRLLVEFAAAGGPLS
jgi:hypothetical protein